MVAFKAPSQSCSGSALSGFRQLYNLLGDCVSGRGNWPVRMLEGHKGQLESDAQETGGLGVKPGLIVCTKVSSRKGKPLDWWRIDAKGESTSVEGVLCRTLREEEVELPAPAAAPRCRRS